MDAIKKILDKKSNRIVTVTTSTRVLDALKIMADQNIGSVVVLDAGAYMGIMTERDYARKIILAEKKSSETTVGEIMSTNLPHVNPNDKIEYCMKIMDQNHVRYLPVFDNGVLLGIISVTDLIHEVVENQKQTISHLQDFISSNFA